MSPCPCRGGAERGRISSDSPRSAAPDPGRDRERVSGRAEPRGRSSTVAVCGANVLECSVVVATMFPFSAPESPAAPRSLFPHPGASAGAFGRRCGAWHRPASSGDFPCRSEALPRRLPPLAELPLPGTLTARTPHGRHPCPRGPCPPLFPTRRFSDAGSCLRPKQGRTHGGGGRPGGRGSGPPSRGPAPRNVGTAAALRLGSSSSPPSPAPGRPRKLRPRGAAVRGDSGLRPEPLAARARVANPDLKPGPHPPATSARVTSSEEARSLSAEAGLSPRAPRSPPPQAARPQLSPSRATGLETHT